MKTPITYYGGKTNMLRHILPLLDKEHNIYVEPFIGGGTVLFAKQPSKIEIINDNLDFCIKFYQVAKLDFYKLQSKIQATLHSETTCKLARQILKNQESYSEVEIAWAFWVQSNMTFLHKIFGGFAFAKSSISQTTNKKKVNFISEISERLENCQIFNRDALDVIKKFDSKDTFFYFDPPYANSDCGHYAKSKDIFYKLLELIPNLQGKWLLSSYPCLELDILRSQKNIYMKDVDQPISAGKRLNHKRKTECLTWNYKIA